MSLPHPAHRLPVIGDVLDQSPSAPLTSLARTAVQTGPIFETSLLGARYVVVSGADLVAEINDDARFTKHVGPELVGLRPAAGNGLFTAESEDPAWRTAHELLMPAFSQRAMHTYHPIMLDVIDELTRKWDSRIGDAVDVPADMTRVALESIARSVAGYTFESFTADAPRRHPFVTHMVGLLKGSLIESFLRRTWLPRSIDTVARKRTEWHAGHLNRIADTIIAERRGMGAADGDLLDLMLSPGPNGTQSLDDLNIRYQLITFLIAGHETTAGALSFALHHLAQRPDLADAARAEIDGIWGQSDRLEFAQVPKLRLVRRIFDETLRLHPTVPAYFRRAIADTELTNGHPVRAGEWFLVLTGRLHRDPLWGGNVDEFDPSRFLPAAVRSRPGHLYKPFGTGMRSCIGRQFAIHESVLVLASILRRYDIQTSPDHELRTVERLTALPKRLQLTLTPR
ncbi:cytochrome P450 [Gordonia zhaorongruii]|uniref:cytochrome P450 n=1 Tax=Gordonia zhaorongruii TaxID=2597659 RepID=UPI00105302A3|nr:cytochrome P450 [Gordonia zhaorongruii]